LVYANHGISLSNSGVTISSDLATQGWGFAVNVDDLAGEAFVTVYSTSDPLPAGAPQLLDLLYQVPATSAPGEYPITVVGSDSRLNEGQLALTLQNGSLIVVDPLTVLNANDDGVGSLRQVINYANTLSGPPPVIKFAIPPGPQTINLLTPLTTPTSPLVFLLDATQNAIVVSPADGSQDAFGVLTKTGAGSLTIQGANNLTGNLQVDNGSLRFDVSATSASTPGLTATVDGAGTLELAGSVAAFAGGSGSVNITNDSAAIFGVIVSGSNQFAGGIDGTGNLAIGAGADLTANHVVQSALVIGGTADHFATLSIAASDASGNPTAAAPNNVANASRQPGGLFAGRISTQVAINSLTAPIAPAIANSSKMAEGAEMTNRTAVESVAIVTATTAETAPAAIGFASSQPIAAAAKRSGSASTGSTATVGPSAAGLSTVSHLSGGVVVISELAPVANTGTSGSILATALVAAASFEDSPSSAAESSPPTKGTDRPLNPAAVAVAFDVGNIGKWLGSARASPPSADPSSDAFTARNIGDVSILADEPLEAIGRG
jgi:autotransporter-associated beta strand protein